MPINGLEMGNLLDGDVANDKEHLGHCFARHPSNTRYN